MKMTITFKHMEHTSALDEKIREKTQRLEKFLQGQIDAKWTCYVKDGMHHADLKLTGPTFEQQASAYSESLYKTLDMVIAKVEKQLVKKKEKWKDHIHHKHEVLAKDLGDGQEKSNEDEYEDEDTFYTGSAS